MENLLSEEIEAALITNVLEQAKCFLEDAGEFYPFGSVIDKEKKLKPVGIYFEDDHPDTTEVLNQLEIGLKKGLENKDYLIAAMGVDVYIKTNVSGKIENKTAIEVRLYKRKILNCFIPQNSSFTHFSSVFVKDWCMNNINKVPYNRYS